MLRTLWFLINLIFSTAFFGVVAISAGIGRVKNRSGGVYDWCAYGWSRRMLRAAGVTVRVQGFEHVPKDRPVVYVSNHQSWFDIWVLLSVVPTHTRFVAKKELTKIPILGPAMVAAGHIPIDRRNRQQALGAYEEAAAYIREGRSAVVFAEGTRSRTGDLQRFKKGPFVLALAAQVPVIPVYLAGTFTLLPKGRLRIHSHPVGVLFGEPITTAGMAYDDRETLMQRAQDAVEHLRDSSAPLLA